MGRTQIQPSQASDDFVTVDELPTNVFNKNFLTITQNYTLQDTDYSIIVQTIIGETIIVTLPPVIKNEYNIINLGDGTVKIQANGIDTINGLSFVTFSKKYDAIHIIGDTEWAIT